ncbi:MAG: hypothetical protein WC894_05465 [Patescibacteria group bacterium]
MTNFFKKLFTKTLEQKRSDFRANYIEKYGNAWLNTEKGITRKPTEDEIAQMLAEAEQDDFKGSVMPKLNEKGERLMVYKLSKDIKLEGSRAY